MVQEALTVCMCFCLLVTEICLTVTASPPGKTQVGGPQTHGSRFSFLGVPWFPDCWYYLLAWVSSCIWILYMSAKYHYGRILLKAWQRTWNRRITIYISTTCSILKSTKIRLTIRKRNVYVKRINFVLIEKLVTLNDEFLLGFD